MKFVYEKEFWFISAFINCKKVDILKKSKEINDLILEKSLKITKNDLTFLNWNPELMEKVIDLGRNLSINCKWVSVLEDFPYYDEDMNLQFDTLGYFLLEVDYYKNNAAKKKEIESNQLQYIPNVALKSLKEFSKQYNNQYIYLDLESPIYIFSTSKEMSMNEIQWNLENIEKFKKVIGMWTEIYSGQWEDYNDSLYAKRITGNLSNRLSELHYIKRNSGFIFMQENNYQLHFNRYIKDSVIFPTAIVRSIVFALIVINKSLDVLFKRQHSEIFDNIEIIDAKIKNLKYLRGMIQTQMTVIYDELDYNRRQHYTSVLMHLLNEFKLNEMIDRISKKFDLIYDSMQILYQKKNDENQNKQQRGMKFLQIFFGFNVVIGLIAAMEGFGNALKQGDAYTAGFKLITIVIGGGIFLNALIYFIKLKIEKTKSNVLNTVDAVIIDEKKNVVLVTRKYPPYKGQRALPGGFIKKGETQENAVIREVKEETNLDVKVIKKIGVFDEKNRDPRGNVISHAFLCNLNCDISTMKCKDDAADIELVPLKTLKGIDLAFDHENILEKAIHLET